MHANHLDVMLSQSEASAFPMGYEKADSSAAPQNDISTQARPGGEDAGGGLIDLNGLNVLNQPIIHPHSSTDIVVYLQSLDQAGVAGECKTRLASTRFGGGKRIGSGCDDV
jgi:hypothetical protein